MSSQGEFQNTAPPVSMSHRRIEQASPTPAVLVPGTAVRTDSDTARVYVVSAAGLAEERIVTTGQTVGDLIEIASGIKAGDAVATSNVAQLADGMRITGTR